MYKAMIIAGGNAPESPPTPQKALINLAGVDFVQVSPDDETKCIVTFNSGRTVTVDESIDTFGSDQAEADPKGKG